MLKANLVTFKDEAPLTVNFNDRGLALPTQRKFKDTGQMLAPATIAVVGVMEYKAKDCGAMFNDRDPESMVRIATTEAELFAKDSIESYRACPITIGHPADDVSSDNLKELIHGQLDSTPFKDEDGEHLSANIVLNDNEAIDLVQTGTSELSSGHACELVLADEDADYDAYKTNIRANHVAIVARGRAKTARIADEAPVILTDELEAKIVTLTDEADQLKAKLDVANESIVGLKDQLATATAPEAIQKLVDARVELVTSAARFVDTDVSKLTSSEIKVLVLKDALGKDYEGKSDAYLDMRYEILLEDGTEAEDDTSITQALKDAANNSVNAQPKDEPSPRERMMNRHTSK